MSKPYKLVNYLLRLDEADGDPMPEMDFSAGADAPPPDDLGGGDGLDSFDTGADEPSTDTDSEVLDIPTEPMSQTDKAVLGLVFANSKSPSRARTLADRNPNAIESVKKLLGLGVLKGDMSNYVVTDMGRQVMQANGLVDEGSESLSKQGVAITHQYFY